jgi:bifunctional enzyme CysN/CysC
MLRLLIDPNDAELSVPDRSTLLGHRGAVLWLTGLSGSGKTTLARGLECALLHHGILGTVLDGDELRRGLSAGLGFSVEDRRESIRRTAEVALHVAEAGAVAIVAHISPFRSSRAQVAARLQERGVPFAEVFVNAPLAVCEQRDPKGLYQRARAGEIPAFTGIDSPYEDPVAPALEIRTDLAGVADALGRLVPLALRLANSGS